jgi:hypothetical protein
MSVVKKYIQSPVFWLVLTFVVYLVGFILMKSPDVSQLRKSGLGERDEYFVTNADGEEYISESLIRIDGVGKVLTYKDVYLSSIPLFFASMFLGCIIFNGGEISTSKMDIKHAIFANCVLGLLLIWVTTKENILPTILFWLGIFTAGISLMFEKKEIDQEE